MSFILLPHKKYARALGKTQEWNKYYTFVIVSIDNLSIPLTIDTPLNVPTWVSPAWLSSTRHVLSFSNFWSFKMFRFNLYFYCFSQSFLPSIFPPLLILFEVCKCSSFLFWCYFHHTPFSLKSKLHIILYAILSNSLHFWSYLSLSSES